MTITVKKIRDLLKDYKTYYGQTRTNQEEYVTFYDDVFKVPWIEDPKVVSRTGSGAELIDEPVAQLSAANLIAFREALKDTQSAEDAAIRVSGLLNDWIKRMMRINPNPKKWNLKNKFLFGESWIHPVHNPNWVMKPFDRTGLPVFPLIPDPRTIYASPNEDENGIPENFIVCYDRMPHTIKAKYPAWTNPKNAGSDKITPKTSTWIEYWDKDVRYFEADEEEILPISPNPYGFVPIVHKLLGLGKSSNEGKPEDLIVSIIHKYRDLLKRDASITSDMDSYIHMFCASPVIITPPEGGEIGKGFKRNFVWKAGHIIENPNRLDISPAQSLAPDPSIFAWHDRIQASLGRKIPDVLAGVPQGETGRLQDISYSTAMRKWEGVVAGDENQWATALGMALRMCDTMPKLMPDGISSDDLKKNYVVGIELRADDPLETARKSADGDMKQEKGIIDWETNLVKYQGFTQADAEEVMDNAVIDRVVFDPVSLRMLALQNAKERGMEEEYLAIEAQMQGETQGGVGSQGGPPRRGNIRTEQGREQVDLSREKKPARLPPQ